MFFGCCQKHWVKIEVFAKKLFESYLESSFEVDRQLGVT